MRNWVRERSVWRMERVRLVFAVLLALAGVEVRSSIVEI